MLLRALFVCALCLGLAGCANPIKRVPKKKEEPPPPARADASGDVSYQAFLGRLRAAVEAKDMAELATMMTANFGYALNPPREGDGVFQYWDEHEVWGELSLVLRERFVPFGSYMVAPAQFAADPENYRGYRAGLANANGSWKFAYFVSD